MDSLETVAAEAADSPKSLGGQPFHRLGWLKIKAVVSLSSFLSRLDPEVPRLSPFPGK